MDKKLKSRKFLFTVLWNLFVVMGMVVTLVINKDVEYMGTIITFAGTITTSYIAGQSFIDHKDKK